MRLRVTIAVFATWLAASVMPFVTFAQSQIIAPGDEFPPGDGVVWRFLERGLKRQAAHRQLAKAPESPETVALLLDAGRPDDALKVLRRIVDRRPERIAAAFTAALTKGSPQFDDEGRGYRTDLRETAATARLRLRELPREQAAEFEWSLRYLPLTVPGEPRVPYLDQLRAFATEYVGTGAGLLGEFELLGKVENAHERIAAFEAFGRAHLGTAIGAQALYRAANDISSNLPLAERRGDPTERLLRIAALARELQSGAYPDCAWVRWAPHLVIGFAPRDAQYGRNNVPRVSAVFREFFIESFDQAPALSPVRVDPYLTSLSALFASGGGDPKGDVERFLIDLATAVKEPAAVHYLRGTWYRRVADDMNNTESPNEWRRKADATLLDLARTGAGRYNRMALSTLAALAFKEKHCGAAVDLYREYLSRFPQSDWAWVAGLRLGQCQELLGNRTEARQAYESVASLRGAPPPARVLGHAFAGRASEALNEFARARRAYERAERAWDPDFADPYFGTYQFYTRLNEEFCNGCDPRSTTDVSKDWLRDRSAQLQRSLTVRSGALLEQGRFFVIAGSWKAAVTPLTEFVRLSPHSPTAAEARELLTRAKLELALLEARPDAGEDGQRAALAALELLAAEPYGFSVFAAQVARATLLSLDGSSSHAADVMSDALTQWHAHGVNLFANRPATPLQRDVADVRDAVFNPSAHWPPRVFDRFRSKQRPPFFIARPQVHVTLHDGSSVWLEASSRLSARPGALLLTEEQVTVLQRILISLGTNSPRTPAAKVTASHSPGVEHILVFWNRFFPMGPSHWGGWLLETFPIIGDVSFSDNARTKGGARVRIGYGGSTQLVTKAEGAWKVTGVKNEWIE